MAGALGNVLLSRAPVAARLALPAIVFVAPIALECRTYLRMIRFDGDSHDMTIASAFILCASVAIRCVAGGGAIEAVRRNIRM